MVSPRSRRGRPPDVGDCDPIPPSGYFPLGKGEGLARFTKAPPLAKGRYREATEG